MAGYLYGVFSRECARSMQYCYEDLVNFVAVINNLTVVQCMCRSISRFF